MRSAGKQNVTGTVIPVGVRRPDEEVKEMQLKMWKKLKRTRSMTSSRGNQRNGKLIVSQEMTVLICGIVQKRYVAKLITNLTFP